MPYSIAQNDIVQITVVYEQLNIVKMLNVLHYRYLDPTPLADGAAAIQRLLDNFAYNTSHVGWVGLWANTAATLIATEAFTGQKIYPVRYARVTYPQVIPGNRTGNPLPGLTQWSITKRGDIAARYAVGGVRVPGLSEDDEQGSQIADAFRPTCQLLANFLTRVIVTNLGENWEPVIYRRLNPGSSVRVTEAFINPTLSTQRTRIAFRGI